MIEIYTVYLLKFIPVVVVVVVFVVFVVVIWKLKRCNIDEGIRKGKESKQKRKEPLES